MFSLCLGKDGGYFQIGGFDGQSHLEDELTWIRMRDTPSFQVNINSISMNDHKIHQAQDIKFGFIDSGTTFSYLPTSLFNGLKEHFDWFCSIDPENNCKGKRSNRAKDNYICFEYSETLYPEGPKAYFASYPILNFNISGVVGKSTSSNDESTIIEWYPSEYLYRDSKDAYCLAVERSNRNDQFLMGGTFMRQKNFIFDIEHNQVAIVKAACNEDPNQISDQNDLLSAG